MKKFNIVINHEKHTITISKAFYKKASIFGTDEYYAFRQVMKENENYTIKFKSTTKNTYSKLTFSRMKEYIETQPNSEMMLIKFDAVKRIAETKGSAYPLVKKWFLKTFPAYKENDIADTESKALEDKFAAEAAAELADIIENDDDDIAA